MEIREDIQFLRGIAVLAVVLFHLEAPFFQNGFLGVDIFFVISGFLMAKLYDRGSILEFYKRRLDRIYPVYIITLFSSLVVGAFLTIPVNFNQLFEQAIAGLLFLSNLYYWNQNSYFDKSAFNPLLNLWSLSVEVQFYLLVPFIYPFLRRSKSLFALIFFVSLVSCFAIQTISPKTSFFLLPFRVWEFLIGAYVAWWCNTRVSSSPNYRTYSLIILCALCLSLFLLELRPDTVGTIFFGHPSLPALVVTVLTGLVLKHGIDTRLLGGLTGRFMVRLGGYSYSIYLVHFPIIVFFNYLPFGGTRLAFDGYFDLSLAIVFILTISAISYALVEKKFSIWLNYTNVRSSIFIFVFLSAFILSSLNLKSYSAVERTIFSAWIDRDTYRCGKIFRILNPFDAVCSISDNAEGRGVLLIGDSHADSIKRVFSEVASVRGFSTFFVVANNPLWGGGPRAEHLIETAVERDVKTLIIHYSNYYDNEKFRIEFRKLLEIAKWNGLNVFVIAPVPFFDVDIPQAMFFSAYNQGALALTQEEHFIKTQSFREFVSGFEHLDVKIFDPSDFLCDAETGCRFSSSDSRPFYFDSNHLTLTGASVLRPLFERLLGLI
jgi:peptidoglycan/LPS O-acetylase OafA/YrhL